MNRLNLRNQPKNQLLSPRFGDDQAQGLVQEKQGGLNNKVSPRSTAGREERRPKMSKKINIFARAKPKNYENMQALPGMNNPEDLKKIIRSGSANDNKTTAIQGQDL